MATTTVIVQTPLKEKIAAWSLIILHYASIFVTPMLAAYYYLAKDTLEEAGKGGFLYFLVIGIFGGAAAFTAIRLINKQKANLLKTTLRTTVKILMLYVIMDMVKYVNVNLVALDKVLWITLGGFVFGSVIEAVTVWKFRDYVREVGVF